MQLNFIDFVNKLEICPLFQNISQQDILEFLHCSKAKLCSYRAEKIIISQGEKVENIGILLQGKAKAAKLDACGNEYLAAQVQEGNLFADLIASRRNNKSPVTITARTSVIICFIPQKSILSQCEKNCQRHTDILSNLIYIFSDKFFDLFDRIDCLTARKTSEKVLILLKKYKNQEEEIILPFDREEMANYLGIDRSALSRELSKMKKNKIIDYKKNKFKILR